MSLNLLCSSHLLPKILPRPQQTELFKSSISLVNTISKHSAGFCFYYQEAKGVRQPSQARCSVSPSFLPPWRSGCTGQTGSVSGDRWKEDAELQNLLCYLLFFIFSCIWLPGFLQTVRLISHVHVCDRWPALCGGISSQRASSIWTRCFSSWGRSSTRSPSCTSTTTAPCSRCGGSASNGWQEDSVSRKCKIGFLCQPWGVEAVRFTRHVREDAASPSTSVYLVLKQFLKILYFANLTFCFYLPYSTSVVTKCIDSHSKAIVSSGGHRCLT